MPTKHPTLVGIKVGDNGHCVIFFVDYFAAKKKKCTFVGRFMFCKTACSMKKILKWLIVAALTPLLLFLLLAVLLYLPPVQNWVADKVAAVASEKTGMDITVGTVRLEWPLDLGIDDFRVIHEGDTLADVGHLTVDVQLRPLLDKRVVINELGVNEAKVNTNGFISDLRVKGHIGELWLRSDGIDLDQGTATVNGARIAD